MGGGVDEESYDEEEVGNDDEVTDAVGIGGGSEEDIGVEEQLERSGMGSDGILEYMEENCKCFFVIFNCLFQLTDMILTCYFNMYFYKSQLNFMYSEV